MDFRCRNNSKVEVVQALRSLRQSHHVLLGALVAVQSADQSNDMFRHAQRPLLNARWMEEGLQSQDFDSENWKKLAPFSVQ